MEFNRFQCTTTTTTTTTTTAATLLSSLALRLPPLRCYANMERPLPVGTDTSRTSVTPEHLRPPRRPRLGTRHPPPPTTLSRLGGNPTPPSPALSGRGRGKGTSPLPRRQSKEQLDLLTDRFLLLISIVFFLRN